MRIIEGYFPVEEYCKLANVNSDTAYHRAIRNEVPNFKDENNRVFIYFTDAYMGVPENFIPMREYAKLYHRHVQTIAQKVRKNIFRKEDVFVAPKSIYGPDKYARIFINKNVRPPMTKETNCPDGYLLMLDWADLNNISHYRVNQMVYHNRIVTVKIGTRRYIKADTLPPIDRRISQKRKII